MSGRPHSFDRRRFLFGAGGAMLALPLLESLRPRLARGAGDAPPKRLLVVVHEQGRLVGNGAPDDWWSPRATTGALPATGTAPSAMLAALASIRDEIVTVDGVDNLVRHASNMQDGHIPALVSALTCMPQFEQQWRSTGPSIDYVAGLRLRASAAMRASIVLPASATPYADYGYSPIQFYGPDGTDGTVMSGNPGEAVAQIFGPPVADPMPVPQPPTLRERMAARRVDLLSGVSQQLASLRARVSSRDRERLDRHAAFIEGTQALLGGGGPSQPTTTCTRPDESVMPTVVPVDYEQWTQTGNLPEWSRGRSDALTWPFQLENAVQALACDVVRVAAIGFHSDPAWSSEFTQSPFEGDGALHNFVHGLQDSSNDPQGAGDVATGFQSYARKFSELVTRLAEIEDLDGSRLLDNTLVVWVSEMGYGSDHQAWNVPVVLAGMRSAFPNGQGRHVVQPGRTMGDLWAHVLRMLGGDDTEFGATGTLGELAAAYGVGDLVLGAGRPGLGASTPLHAGPLDL
ncbi:MAG: DUF1552 domain-containing protein [Deltaproteobacteria bacterium]|nr:DUF1552 domain-containing protein [Deltaproteobacteria bacterium]